MVLLLDHLCFLCTITVTESRLSSCLLQEEICTTHLNRKSFLSTSLKWYPPIFLFKIYLLFAALSSQNLVLYTLSILHGNSSMSNDIYRKANSYKFISSPFLLLLFLSHTLWCSGGDSWRALETIWDAGNAMLVGCVQGKHSPYCALAQAPVPFFYFSFKQSYLFYPCS